MTQLNHQSHREDATNPPTGGVLVAVCFDAPSAVALARGRDLARRLAMQLRVVHVTEETDHESACAAVRHWAETEAAVTLTTDAITVRSGKPVGEIWREANAMNADLLVLGGVVGGATPGWLVRFLAQHARRPVLIASTPHKPGIVAATDLRDNALPVLHYAAGLVERTGGTLQVVHNVAPQSERVVGRALRPLDVRGGLMREIAHLDEVRITTEPSPAEAILNVAQNCDADVVAVGAHETSGRTLRDLVLGASRSVLAIPLGSSRERAGVRPRRVFA